VRVAATSDQFGVVEAIVVEKAREEEKKTKREREKEGRKEKENGLLLIPFRRDGQRARIYRKRGIRTRIAWLIEPRARSPNARKQKLLSRNGERERRRLRLLQLKRPRCACGSSSYVSSRISPKIQFTKPPTGMAGAEIAGTAVPEAVSRRARTHRI